MISKVKNAMSNLVGGMMPHGHHHHNHHSGGQTCGTDSLPPRFPYGRPDFLDLTPELLQYSTEHASRPVLTLKRGSRLPWQTGYAEWVYQWFQWHINWSENHWIVSVKILQGSRWVPGLISDFYLFIFIAAAVSSALQQPNNGQCGLLLLNGFHSMLLPWAADKQCKFGPGCQCCN